MIGFAAVIGLFLGTVQHGQLVSDRNAAAVLIPDAARQIEKEHLITAQTQAAFPSIPASKIGMFIETLQSAAESDDDPVYGNVTVNGAPLGMPGNLNEWPRRPARPAMLGGGNYRVRYRLEKHPAFEPATSNDWMPHDIKTGVATGPENVSSSFRGVYVLTLLCCRDNEQDMSKPVPVSDPIVVYLRDRKMR